MIISFVAFLVVLAIGIWWLSNRSDTNSQQTAESGDCSAGDLTLLVAAHKDDQTQALLDSYAKSKPVVKDYCVRTEVVDDVANAALALLPGTKETINSRLQAAGRTASTDNYPIAMRTPIGVSSAESEANSEGSEEGHDHEGHNHEDHNHEGHSHDDNTWAGIAHHNVTVPGKNANFYSAVAATALSDGDPDNAANLLRTNSDMSLADAVSAKKQRIATTESEKPEGYDFTSPENVRVATLAVPLNSGGTVTEEESRAAAHFARYVAENVDQTAPTHNETLLYTTAQVALDRYTAQPTLSPDQQNKAKDTLLILDASAAMAQMLGDQTMFSQTVQLAEPQVLKVGEKGGQVSLWNYSSPLNPGVTKGWRNNIPFSDQSQGRNAVDAMKQLGNDGEPWTRSSILAAMGSAAEHAKVTGNSTHVILVTSGTADRMTVHELWDELENFHDADVHLHVIHVGDDAVDESLATWSKEHFGSAVTVRSPQELSTELDRAFADTFTQ